MLTAQGEWMPEDEHSSVSSMTLRTALRTSSNRAAVRLLHSVGMDTAMRYVRSFDFDVPAVPALALGAGEVTLASMTAAFRAFASKGFVRTPVLIRRVEDGDGQFLAAADNPPRQVISEVTAFLVANMLADVINSGTGWKARAEGFTLPAAGKTGTTNEYRDVWFVGFTPRTVAGVWIGFDQPTADHRERLRGRTGGAALGAGDEGRDRRRSAHVAGTASGARGRAGVPGVRASCRARAARRWR